MMTTLLAPLLAGAFLLPAPIDGCHVKPEARPVTWGIGLAFTPLEPSLYAPVTCVQPPVQDVVVPQPGTIDGVCISDWTRRYWMCGVAVGER